MSWFFFSLEEPKSPPLMLAGKLKYIKDEPVKINCTSYSAFPATNLTWFINDKKVSKPNTISTYIIFFKRRSYFK